MLRDVCFQRGSAHTLDFSETFQRAGSGDAINGLEDVNQHFRCFSEIFQRYFRGISEDFKGFQRYFRVFQRISEDFKDQNKTIAP